MTRSRRSARDAGAKTERMVADYLAEHVDPNIDRRVKRGAKDRGDVGGLKHLGQRGVVEVKDTARWTPGTWLNEAEIERGNDDAGFALVVAKRVGRGQPGDQIVMCTLRDLVSLLTGTRPEED